MNTNSISGRVVHLRTVAFALVIATPLAAQSDSVMKLNRAGRYEQALTLARTGLSADATNDERCVLRLGSLIAVTRLGAYETASRDLSTLDSQCATNPV